MRLRHFLIVCTLLITPAVMAEPAAIVEGLQMPVILDRNGGTQALEPGMSLADGDRLLTGNQARVLLRLADGSHVKLGENAEFYLASIDAPTQAESTFKAAFNVVKGAFRFTTGLINRYKNREVSTQIRAVTIGIRGTDVWGKSEPERDFVVLLEGQISIQRDNEPEQTMSEAMSLFMAPRDQPALPIGPVNPDDLAIWAQETELQAEQGVIHEQGKWLLNLASYQDSELALAKQNELRQLGYPAVVNDVTLEDQVWHRLAIRGFSTVADARNLAQQLADRFGFGSAWAGPQ